ncbi:phage holin family protein [Microbacterium sp. KUDC0406]|uniref:phage holin family protein n=1 Tax=Microbacterium sp. KUDC0406 TaxID=2909588 RepID=UPI001F2BF973|nr:phage holin family protein [Microbacterium sp. KUDC0406]UJP09902.1 phage holin family protein [Microbacterium sp. KUDC0406]
MVRGYRDRADDSLLTLLGDMPDLVSNLVKAEIDAGKAWVQKTSKDAGISGVWFLIALFFLFWAIPVILVFAIAGFASWMPVWASALIVFGILILAVLVFGLLGVLRFRKVLKRENPAQAVSTDIRLVREAGDERPREVADDEF